VTYSDAIQFLYDLRWFGTKFGLKNTFKLAELAGNPQEKLRFIHVAGTNGKGSTCAMLESIYRSAGLRVGLFTSPHLVSFSERIQVNRKLIRDSEVVRLVGEMQALLEKGWPAKNESGRNNEPTQSSTTDSSATFKLTLTEHPTFFEVVTVMAMRYFTEQNCDLVVWETGLGGRLDATNIVTPLASVITNIQYDHQKWLGESLAGIASEKAGIIKAGVPVVTGTTESEALRVIERTAQERTAPLTLVTPTEINQSPLDSVQLPLPGRHQRMNAAVALATVRTIASHVPVDDDAIRSGLYCLDWPGRLQLVTQPSGQKILLDGAHNVGGAEILAAALREDFSSPKPAMVLGVLSDKDWPAMCRILAPVAGRILLVPVHSERTAEPHGLAEVCRSANPEAEVCEYSSLKAALAATVSYPFITIAGSLYLVGEAMELLGLYPGKGSGERGLNEWHVAHSPADVLREKHGTEP
jgi:dihydrofolate synthase/folylpolyglutamate synthase